MFMPYPYPYPLPAVGRPVWATPPYYSRPRPLPARHPLLGLPAHGLGGFGVGPAAIEPGYLFFSGGHPIGGPIGTSYRGVRAGVFPYPAVYLGSGGPLDSEMLSFAGAPIGVGPVGPGRFGAPIL